MPNGNWVPLPPFAQQFLTHLLMNKSSFLWKRIDGQNLKGKSALMDVNWKLEYRKRMKRFIIVQTLSLAPAGMRKLGITICWTSFRFLLCWEISKNGWNYNFLVILLLCSRNKEFSSIAYRVYWWGYRSQGTAVLLYQQVLTLLSALLLAIICFFFSVL